MERRIQEIDIAILVRELKIKRYRILIHNEKSSILASCLLGVCRRFLLSSVEHFVEAVSLFGWLLLWISNRAFRFVDRFIAVGGSWFSFRTASRSSTAVFFVVVFPRRSGTAFQFLSVSGCSSSSRSSTTIANIHGIHTSFEIGGPISSSRASSRPPSTRSFLSLGVRTLIFLIISTWCFRTAV
jgi:hypothetical protein